MLHRENHGFPRVMCRSLRELFCSCLRLESHSPESKPIGRVWRLTRKLCTHNWYL